MKSKRRTLFLKREREKKKHSCIQQTKIEQKNIIIYKNITKYDLTVYSAVCKVPMPTCPPFARRQISSPEPGSVYSPGSLSCSPVPLSLLEAKGLDSRGCLVCRACGCQFQQLVFRGRDSRSVQEHENIAKNQVARQGASRQENQFLGVRGLRKFLSISRFQKKKKTKGATVKLISLKNTYELTCNMISVYIGYIQA